MVRKTSETPQDSALQHFTISAQFYDSLYSDKSYRVECDFIEKAFRKYSRAKIRTILDAGCGTGGHALLLSRRGYKLTAFDSSEEMVQIARAKNDGQSTSTNFMVGDIINFKTDKTFDACTSMFAVFNYVASHSDLKKAITNIWNALRNKGILVLDIWNGIAVLRQGPSTKVKTVKKGDTMITRIAQPTLDPILQKAYVRYRYIAARYGEIVNDATELHIIRFLTPQQMRDVLEDNGFDVVRICTFPHISQDIDANAWNISFIAVKK